MYVLSSQLKNDFGFSKSAQDILSEFDAILRENKESVKETDKKIWWSCRQKLDERMEVSDLTQLFIINGIKVKAKSLHT